MRDERSPTRGLLRETVTIADLAVRLGLTLEDTYELCRAHGVRAARPTTRISRDHADRLRRARFGHLEREWGTADTAFREARTTDVAVREARRALGGTAMATEPDDPEMAAIARNLGIRSHHRARPTRKPDEPPLTGTAAAIVRIWSTTSRERAQQIAVAWTGEHYFTDVEAAAWWTVGRLGPDEALLASMLRENGVRPEHMMVSVRHETILARLRDGMAPEQVARILRDAGEL